MGSHLSASSSLLAGGQLVPYRSHSVLVLQQTHTAPSLQHAPFMQSAVYSTTGRGWCVCLPPLWHHHISRECMRKRALPPARGGGRTGRAPSSEPGRPPRSAAAWATTPPWPTSRPTIACRSPELRSVFVAVSLESCRCMSACLGHVGTYQLPTAVCAAPRGVRLTPWAVGV